MGAEDAKKFVELFHTDKKLREKMKVSKTNEEKKKISDDLGLSFSKEDLEKAFTARTEISDEDLDAVAGGGSATWIATGGTVVAAFAACGW